ncbi:hypothetical protein L798_14027 [Zootermopsis nevadensis]|uniref:Uncharacterized protein n=1 Tax=Zootermopsis nevadensis TaxID=136037 RepID=A0A067QP54_ZOONE|nr:hypothetical protein L798_14027 [Zootermopsis nevadensis]
MFHRNHVMREMSKHRLKQKLLKGFHLGPQKIKTMLGSSVDSLRETSCFMKIQPLKMLCKMITHVGQRQLCHTLLMERTFVSKITSVR